MITHNSDGTGIAGLTFVELPTHDFRKSLTFYRNTLGFTIAHLDEANGWCWFAIPNSSTGCAIYTVDEKTYPCSAQNTVRMTIRVSDFDVMCQVLRNADVRMENVRVHEKEQFRISGFTDPGGNVWRFWSPL